MFSFFELEQRTDDWLRSHLSRPQVLCGSSRPNQLQDQVEKSFYHSNPQPNLHPNEDMVVFPMFIKNDLNERISAVMTN